MSRFSRHSARRRRPKRAGAAPLLDRKGRRWALGNQGRVHMLMAAHCMTKIETIYGSIFEGILGETDFDQAGRGRQPFPVGQPHVAKTDVGTMSRGARS